VGIFAAFGFLAIVLVAVGLYSLVAYSVIQRRREIGIRIAVGAAPQAVVAGILRLSMRLTLVGLALGTAAGLLLARYLGSQVKEVSPYDLPTFAAAALLIAAVSFAAAIIPARHAARADPLAAFRAD
jgi:ABC-type antimicrobial peptide transport system permease subunit